MQLQLRIHSTERVRNVSVNPASAMTVPAISIHMALFVGVPVKNRDTSELNESMAVNPRTISTAPAPRSATEIASFIEFQQVTPHTTPRRSFRPVLNLFPRLFHILPKSVCCMASKTEEEQGNEETDNEEIPE